MKDMPGKCAGWRRWSCISLMLGWEALDGFWNECFGAGVSVYAKQIIILEVDRLGEERT